MDSYFRKAKNLKSGEKDMVVSRTASPQPSTNRSHSVERRVPEKSEKKVAYQADIQEVTKKLDDMKASVSVLQSAVKENHDEVFNKVQEIQKQMENVKQESDQTKAERIKNKLDDFISKYNDNEKAHSDALIIVEKELRDLDGRVANVESVL